MEKPLIPLRIGDLVTNESTFADDMTKRLQNAQKLGAIILLDEADVILESRSFEDVKRNGIVSGELIRTRFIGTSLIPCRSFSADAGILRRCHYHDYQSNRDNGYRLPVPNRGPH
jgi:hypothetical protein